MNEEKLYAERLQDAKKMIASLEGTEVTVKVKSTNKFIVWKVVKEHHPDNMKERHEESIGLRPEVLNSIMDDDPDFIISQFFCF